MGNGDAVVIDLAAARMMARQQRMKANRMATCGVCVGGHDFGALNCSGRSAECPEMQQRSIPVWMRQKLHLTRELNRGLRQGFRRRYVFTAHHESHAASAFFPSPFDEAAILTLDGVGEWATGTYGTGRGRLDAVESE